MNVFLLVVYGDYYGELDFFHDISITLGVRRIYIIRIIIT